MDFFLPAKRKQCPPNRFGSQSDGKIKRINKFSALFKWVLSNIFYGEISTRKHKVFFFMHGDDGKCIPSNREFKLINR